MAVSTLEVVELTKGEYALRRADSEDAPLVKIAFSPEVRQFLGLHEPVIVRAMIAAGIEAVAVASRQSEEATDADASHTVH